MYDEALLFAIKAHENQIRKDGKPYIIHTVSVALELAKNGADDDLICAGLLHDTVEDTNITLSYDIVECDGRTGVMYELIKSKTLGELMREDEENLDKYIDMYVDVCKKSCLNNNK